MAAQGEDCAAVGDLSAPEAAPEDELSAPGTEAAVADSCAAVEMRTLTGAQSEGCADNNSGWKEADDMGNESAVTVHSSSAIQEPCVKFIVKDITQTDWAKSRYSCCLPQSTAVIDLYAAVAKEAGYEDDSFLLAWYVKESADVAEATPLSPKSTQTLYELDMPTEPARCYLYLQDGPDSPPVRVAAQNSSVQTEGQSIELANSVTTTPSTHSVTYTNTWSTTHHYSNKSETGFVGLVNQAMTCYLNSLLQTLYMTPEFRRALYSWKFDGDIGEGIKSIPYQLQRLFIHLETSTKRAVETTDVTKSFGWDSSEAWQQHDVQELCRVMFDALEKRLRKDGYERPELINELYQGDMKDYVKCLECDNESAREDHFLDIPLVIKPFGSSKAYGSVEEALDGFVDPETLSGDNQYFCDKCKKKCDAHKGLKFTKFPYLLTMQLKRFDFDYSTMHRMKLNDRMTFPSVLNLNKFIDQSDMPENKDSDSDLDTLYQDFVIERFEQRSTYIMPQSSERSDMEPVTATKLTEMLKEGPYVYELFSIMIHSGSAIGGHYYAYIKSLDDKQWYSFNDQSVTRISREEIEQTFGGSDRSRTGYYSSLYASSANAYMLMYRKVDKQQNMRFVPLGDLPEHVQEQIREERQQEQREKERQEWERNLCKFRVFMRHPTTNDMVERKIEVHKDKTLREATLEAYKNLGLSRLVPIERCRLVKFDEYTETLDQSFDLSEQDAPFGNHVGGARSYYSFELFMEIRPEGSEFKVYNKGGLNLKILVIHLPEETVDEPVQMRAEQGWTVAELKTAIAQRFSLDVSVMSLALETYQNEGKHLSHSEQTLKSEGFYRKHTVFVCCDQDDYHRDFHFSLMNHVIDKHANTITLFVTVPPPPTKPRRGPDGTLVPSQPTLTNGPQQGFDDNFVTTKSSASNRNEVSTEDSSRGEGEVSTEDSSRGEGEVSTEDCSRGEREVSTEDCSRGEGEVSTEDSSRGEGEVSTEDSSRGEGEVSTEDSRRGEGEVSTEDSKGEGEVLTEDSRRREGEVSTEDSRGEGEVSTENSRKGEGEGCVEERAVAGEVAEEQTKSSSTCNGEEEPAVNMSVDGNRPLQRTITLLIDRRKTLGDLKQMLEEIVLVHSTEFKIYRVYSNNQEYEVFRLQDSLQSVPNETRMIVRLGRALLPGEFRIKLSLLRINETEYFKSLMDSIVAKGMTVRELKDRLVKEAYEQGIEFPLQVDRIRLRKKTWRSPGTVYLNPQVFEKDIHVFANYEMFVEPLEGEEPMKHATQMQIYVRRWRPSTFTMDKTQEVILNENTPDHLKLRISEFSGIPVERVMFAKAYGSFPCEMSVLDLENDLEWNPPVSTINSSPLAIYDDGAVLYFKDGEEALAELGAERKAEIMKQENSRLSQYSVTGSTTRRKPEPPLKIFTGDEEVTNSSVSRT